MMSDKFYIATIKIFSILLFATIATQAAPGSLDITFGTGGKVTTPVGSFTNYAQAVAVQPDGKIIAVGESNSGMSIARFNANGTLDTTFNGTGIAAFLPGSAYAVALLPGGKFLVAGNNGNVANIDFQLRRYNSNGTLDTTFDGDGIVDTPVGPATDVAYAIAVQPDGKIVVSGRADSNPIFVTNYGIVRYNPDGTLDPTFDGDGIVISPGPGNSLYDSIAIQPDGKLVFARTLYSNSTYVATVLRYNANGSLDTDFGTDGRVSTPIGQGVEFTSMALQTDGKIVVACSAYVSNALGYDFAVLRFNSDGSADSSFGTDGLVTTSIGSGAAFDIPRAVAIQANGKIVVAGRSPNGSNKDFAIVRYNRNGTLDPKFGTGGIVKTDLGGAAEDIYAVAIQQNGRIVVAGESDFGSAGTRKFALARYMGDAGENFDYDRDGASDISVYRPSEGTWYILGSSADSFFGGKWGLAADELAPGDYDGDLKTDIAVWRSGPSAYFYILNSSNNTVRVEQFGQTGDDPSVVADYDGDGMADPAVYRAGAAPGQPSFFYYRASANNPNGDTTYIPWGTNGDIAARGDYNGDGRFDPTVFRPSTGVWHSLNLADNAYTAIPWGVSTDTLVPADYDGDGKTDRAVFRNGTWFILESSTSQAQYAYWGFGSDKPVPADYDRDGHADVAIYRSGTWYIQQTTNGNRVIPFGLSTDTPTPAAYLP